MSAVDLGPINRALSLEVFVRFTQISIMSKIFYDVRLAT